MSSRTSFFGLSVTQLVASALAAITATVAGSTLGVTGTVLGAAVASVLTGVATAIYTQSLQRVRAAGPRPPESEPEADDPPQLPRPARRSGPSPWRRVAFATVGVFVVILAAITGVEVVVGRPISDIVRGDSASGTSLFGRSPTTPSPTPVHTPTVVVTVTPQVVVTTPTITRTAAPQTTTVTPSPVTSTAPTRAPTQAPTPSAAASDTASAAVPG